MIMTASYLNNGELNYLFSTDSEFCAKFREDGYLILRSAVPDELVDKIRYEIEETFLSADESARPTMSGIQPEIGRFQDAWRKCPSVNELAGLHNILLTLKELYGRDPHPFQTLVFSTPTQQPAHSDHIHFSSIPNGFMCGVWVALEDVTSTNGPLFYFPGSHNLAYMNYHDLNITKNPAHEEAAHQEYEARLEPLMLNLGFKKEVFYAKKGDVLIWSANLVHGGSLALDAQPSRWSQVTHYLFDNCVHYTPRLSDEMTGDLYLRKPIDILTGQPIASVNRSTQEHSAELQEAISERDSLVLKLSDGDKEHSTATLVLRDWSIGVLAELAEFKARDQIAAQDLLDATDALRTEMTKGFETGESLVAEMTRAHEAETLVLKLQAEVANIQRLQNELDALRRSRAFKIGRAVTAPIRILRRIFS